LSPTPRLRATHDRKKAIGRNEKRRLEAKATLLALLGAGAVTARATPPTPEAVTRAAAATREDRPPKVPVVAVGSVIPWNVPYVENGTAR